MADLVPPDDFLAQLGVSSDQRSIIARSALEFERTGDWVTFNTLAYEAAERDTPQNINDVFQLPSALGGAWADEKVSLTGLGVLLAGTAPGIAATMVRLAQICAERKLRLKDDAKVGRAVLVSEYGFADPDAVRAQQLVQMIPGVSAGGNLGDDWSLSIFRTALDYRKVATTDDLLAIFEQQAMERLRQHQQVLAAPPLFAQGDIFSDAFAAPMMPGDQVEQQSPSNDGPIEIFVIMPFDKAWDGVYDMIRRARDRLGAPEGGTRLYRADELATPGQITEQIEQAIESAHVIVADISGLNPNVMWELGYAAALRKPLVVLNQNPSSSPFDVRNIRQVQYQHIPTQSDETSLVRHLDGAIRVAFAPEVPAWLVEPQPTTITAHDPEPSASPSSTSSVPDQDSPIVEARSSREHLSAALEDLLMLVDRELFAGSPLDLARRAKDLGLLDDGNVDAVDSLEVMYRLADMKDEKLTTREAYEYSNYVEAMLSVLRHIKNERRADP